MKVVFKKKRKKDLFILYAKHGRSMQTGKKVREIYGWFGRTTFNE
jgi:hypothetical protein